MQAVYLNPLSDFGFKKLFGEELSQFTPTERKADEDSSATSGVMIKRSR